MAEKPVEEVTLLELLALPSSQPSHAKIVLSLLQAHVVICQIVATHHDLSVVYIVPPAGEEVWEQATMTSEGKIIRFATRGGKFLVESMTLNKLTARDLEQTLRSADPEGKLFEPESGGWKVRMR